MSKARLAPLLLSALAALLVGACSDSHKPAAGPAPRVANLEAPRAAAFAGARKVNDTLAYEHSVAVEIDKEKLEARLQEVRSACTPDGSYSCTLLDVSASSSDSVPAASLRMRLAPAGVDPLIALASKDGRIVHRSTHAEDLAEPISDTERQLSLLTTHRDRLTQIMKAKDLKVDQLITVSRELSSVQTQIDALASQRANLRRRVDTEVLSIELAPPSYVRGTGQTPIRDALGSFGLTLREAAANVIDFVAALLPWLVIGIPGLILLRLLWRWITRWIQRREARG